MNEFQGFFPGLRRRSYYKSVDFRIRAQVRDHFPIRLPESSQEKSFCFYFLEGVHVDLESLIVWGVKVGKKGEFYGNLEIPARLRSHASLETRAQGDWSQETPSSWETSFSFFKCLISGYNLTPN